MWLLFNFAYGYFWDTLLLEYPKQYNIILFEMINIHAYLCIHSYIIRSLSIVHNLSKKRVTT